MAPLQMKIPIILVYNVQHNVQFATQMTTVSLAIKITIFSIIPASQIHRSALRMDIMQLEGNVKFVQCLVIHVTKQQIIV